jgi:hypothetical protein
MSLTQIALRARRSDAMYSSIFLKANQALVGDREKLGLSEQEYRTAKKKLQKWGLATFKPTNKGTIATLTSTNVYDINAEECVAHIQHPHLSMENRTEKHSINDQISISQQINIEPPSNKELLTRMKEGEEVKKTTTSSDSRELYLCLQNCPDLSIEEKTSLMKYPQNRVEAAIDWAPTQTIKKSLIGALHWHCKQDVIPSTSTTHIGQTPQQTAAWEYNRLLKEQGYEELASRNEEAISKDHIWIVQNGSSTTVTLKAPLEILRTDLTQSRNELLKNKDPQPVDIKDFYEETESNPPTR